MLELALIETLDKLKKQGRTYHEIANALGISYSTTYRAINRIDTYKFMCK